MNKFIKWKDVPIHAYFKSTENDGSYFQKKTGVTYRVFNNKNYLEHEEAYIGPDEETTDLYLISNPFEDRAEAKYTKFVPLLKELSEEEE